MGTERAAMPPLWVGAALDAQGDRDCNCFKEGSNHAAKTLTIPDLEKSMATAPKIPNDRPRPLPVVHLPDIRTHAPAAAHVAEALPAVRRGPGRVVQPPDMEYSFNSRFI